MPSTLRLTRKVIPPPWYKEGGGVGWWNPLPPRLGFWYVAIFRNDFAFNGKLLIFSARRGIFYGWGLDKYKDKENWRVDDGWWSSGKSEDDRGGFNIVMPTRSGRERVFTSRMRDFLQSRWGCMIQTASISALTSLCTSVRKRALKIGLQILYKLGFRPLGWELWFGAPTPPPFQNHLGNYGPSFFQAVALIQEK